MKILVVSDSHKRLNNLITMFEREKPDVVICAGDHSKDGEELSYLYPDTKFYIVRGNCDIFDYRHKDEESIELEGVKILLAHGHEYGVKSSYEKIFKSAKSRGFDIAIFGHTHRKLCHSEGGLTLFNPGAANVGEYGIMEIINKGDVRFSHKNI